MTTQRIAVSNTADLARHLRRIAVIDRRWATAGAVFVIAISVYGATVLPGVSSFDAAEMQTVPTVLGIAHPTGYPLWTLLGFLWTRLPLASPALMLNLLSAILFALAAATLALISLRLGVRPVLAAVAGLTFAFASETWARATQAETHSLHTLLVALLLLAWIAAEQTGSSRAALAMILITSIGLTHHRLVVISVPPLLMWFFVRHLKLFRSPSFVLDAILAGLAPLLVYVYLAIRVRQHPSVVEADIAHGAFPIVRADVLASHEQLFTRASPGRWLHTLPSYGDLAVSWVGWPVVLLGLAGAAYLALRRRPMFVGLALVMLATTYGLANRTDRDDRWLLIPVFVLCVFASVGLEAAARIISHNLAQVDERSRFLAPTVAVLIPVFALVMHYSTYDRSADARDAANGQRILSALAPDAVIWSYWDVRTTLQYLTAVEKTRPDVSVLDHRSYAWYGCTGCEGSGDAIVALGVATDPSFADRPYYYIPLNSQQLAAVSQRFRVEPVLRIDLPFGFDDRGAGWLYRVQR